MSNKPWDRDSDYGPPGADSTYNAGKTTLKKLGLTLKQKFLYLFDYGDEWWHSIEVVGIGEHVPGKKYPQVIKSRGDSPPQYYDHFMDEEEYQE